MNEDEEIEQEIIEQLIKSKGILGELNEVVYDSDGEILSGRHRIKAGWEKERVIDTEATAKKLNLPRKLVKEMFKMHFNVQRRPSKEETQRRMLLMAEELVSAGVPKENVASELAKWVPYSDRYIRELLPDEYKHEEMAREIAELVPQKEGEPELVQPTEGQKTEPDPESIIRKIIELRDEKLPYKHLYDKIIDLPGFVRISRAIEQGKSADEVIATMLGRTTQLEPTKPEEVETIISQAEQHAHVIRKFTEYFTCPHCNKPFIINSDVPLPNKSQYDTYKSFEDLRGR